MTTPNLPLCFNMTTFGAAIESIKAHKDVLDPRLHKSIDAKIARQTDWATPMVGDSALFYISGILVTANKVQRRARITMDKQFWADILEMGFAHFQIEKTAVRFIPSIDPEAVAIEYTPYQLQNKS